MVLSLTLIGGMTGAVEPDLVDYTAYPIFTTESVEPNLLIIMDNSGSMNMAAYGTWGGDYGGAITDMPYSGSSPWSHVKNIRVAQQQDDAEEHVSDGTVLLDGSDDLDLGEFEGGDASIVGIRFQDINIPQGATITSAYIEFVAVDNESAATSITIWGQDANFTEQFSSTPHDVSSRPNTAASVSWHIPGSTPWTAGTTYQTPDLSSIIQEIVNRSGWVKGNSMAFKFSGSGKRDAKSYDYPAEAPQLHVEFTPEEPDIYYGLFDPYAQYSYVSNVFVRDASGPWNGNWLNWLSMRRIDVARKVLVGGLATSRTGGGNTTVIGDDHNTQPSRYWKRRFDSTGSAINLSPYNGDYWFGMKDGYIWVDNDSDPFTDYIARYKIEAKKVEADEPQDFLDGNIAGVIQRVRNRVRFGLEFYNYSEGGVIAVPIDHNKASSLVLRIENKKVDTWTPLAEAFYEGVRYFMQTTPYYAMGDFVSNNLNDPYYWKDRSEFVECGKSFILLITDGESTEDQNIPSSLTDYDGDGNDPGTYDNNGSDYLDDVALWARTNDLRPDLDGTQNIIFYNVFAFGEGSQLLQDAAINGGFVDKNGNNLPDQASEWDEDGDGLPDTYFEAPDGYELERQLLKAIADILKRAAAGTAVSVLATSGEGEGNLVQAYFRPTVTQLVGTEDVTWVGYMGSLWVDTYGNLHEDTDGDLKLDINSDKVVEYFFDSALGDSKIRRFSDFVPTATTPYPDTGLDIYEILELEDISPVWEAGSRLASRDADDREIFTYLDKDKNSIIDEPSSDDDPLDGDGELISFDLANFEKLSPYLGVQDHTTWNYLGYTHEDRVKNLIRFIRGDEGSYTGTDTLNVRSRTVDGKVWKLGDIVHSTPVTISAPPDNYDIIYADESYGNYRTAMAGRETMVYVGANDGMLHAFTSWVYDRTTKQYTKPSSAPGGECIGDELWAYIPQSLLPHLKWLPKNDYTHVYYVDLKPKMFDAKILPDDTHYTDGDTDDNWGTILLAGLNMGGKYIWAEGDFDDGSGTTVTETREFYPSYVCMDVTDPRNPRVLWERTYQDLNFTTSVPAVVKVKDKWFAVFGSGPENYEGTSTTNSHIYVVDLKTGDAYPDLDEFASTTNDGWLFEGLDPNAFMNSPTSFDKDLNYSVDAIYFGEDGKDSSRGKVYRISIPWDWNNPDTYVDNPNDSSDPWTFTNIFATDRPITAPVSVSLDFEDNVWAYFGTGRYLGTADKTTITTQYLYGIKDPFFRSASSIYHDYTGSTVLGRGDLFAADSYVVTTGGSVFDGTNYYGSWSNLLSAVRSEEGWYRTLLETGERSVIKFSILGGIVFATTYVPNNDICSFGGTSYLYGLHFETGTAYTAAVFNDGTSDFVVGGSTYQQVNDKLDLGEGKSSALGFHVGQEEGARAFIQQSTGTVLGIDTDPAFSIKSGLINWRQQ